MSDYHVEQLDAVIKAYRSKNRLKRHGDVVTKELFEMGLGFYQFPDGKDLQIDKISTFEKLAELKDKHQGKLVRLQKHQVQAFADYLKKQEDALYKKGFDALADVKSKKDLGIMTIEMEAAVAAALEFQLSWNKGAVVEAKLKTDVAMKMDGKYATFSTGAHLAVKAKAELHLNHVSAEVTVDASVEAELKSKPIKIGDTSYSVDFYTQWKAYAKAEAKFDARIEFSTSNFLNVSAKGRLFAGVGISGEIGVELNGKFERNGNTNTRLLAKLNLNAKVEAGAVLSFGGSFADTTEVKIGNDDFIKKTFDVEIGYVTGMDVTVNVLVLKEIPDSLQDKIKGHLKTLVGKIVGDDMMDHLKVKYDGFKKKAEDAITHIGRAIYNEFNEDSYKGLYYTMDSSIRRLDVHIKRLEENPKSEENIGRARVRLKKIEEDLNKYKVKIEGVREDCRDLMSNIADLLATGDMDDKTFFTRSSKILDEVEDAKDEIATILSAIEGVTQANLEMIDLENMLDDKLIDEDLLTSQDGELLDNRRKMDSLLLGQTYMHDSLDYITEELSNLLVAEMEKRK